MYEACEEWLNGYAVWLIYNVANTAETEQDFNSSFTSMCFIPITEHWFPCFNTTILCNCMRSSSINKKMIALIWFNSRILLVMRCTTIHSNSRNFSYNENFDRSLNTRESASIVDSNPYHTPQSIEVDNNVSTDFLIQQHVWLSALYSIVLLATVFRKFYSIRVLNYCKCFHLMEPFYNGFTTGRVLRIYRAWRDEMMMMVLALLTYCAYLKVICCIC